MSGALLTSNLPFDEWTEVFGSERLRDGHAGRLFKMIGNREGNLSKLAEARANGAPTGVFERNIAGIEAQIRAQARRVAEAGAVYAALPRAPHREIDRRSDARRESAERSARGIVRTMGAGIAAAGAASAHVAQKVSRDPRVRAAAKVAGKAFGMAEAGIAFGNSIQESLGKAIARSGIDTGDEKAVRAFAESNKDQLQQASNRALIAAVAAKFSSNAAKNLAKLIGVWELRRRFWTDVMNRYDHTSYDLSKMRHV